MQLVKPNIEKIVKEARITTSRSGGPGGQSVNKINTKVTLRWMVTDSLEINQEQQQLILTKLRKIINQEGEVVIAADSHRSQLQNKEEAIKKLDAYLTKALKVEKPRKPTKPTKSSIKKRLESKKRLSEKKQQRRKI